MINLRAAINDIRRLAYQLGLPVCDELGLVGSTFQRSDQGGYAKKLPELPAAIEMAAYRTPKRRKQM